MSTHDAGVIHERVKSAPEIADKLTVERGGVLVRDVVPGSALGGEYFRRRLDPGDPGSIAAASTARLALDRIVAAFGPGDSCDITSGRRKKG